MSPLTQWLGTSGHSKSTFFGTDALSVYRRLRCEFGAMVLIWGHLGDLGEPIIIDS